MVLFQFKKYSVVVVIVTTYLGLIKQARAAPLPRSLENKNLQG